MNLNTDLGVVKHATIPANLVREGDFIVGLDNGYVIDVETDEVSNPTGRFAESLGVMTVITFNDAEGYENYLILRSDHPVDVRTEDGSDPLDRKGA